MTLHDALPIFGKVMNMNWMNEWYKSAFDCAPPTAQVTLELITAERVDLYFQVPPPGEKIPASVKPFQVEDWVPTKDDIEWAVMRFQNNRSGVSSGMRADHLKG